MLARAIVALMEGDEDRHDFVVMVCVSLLYSWHVHRTTETELNIAQSPAQLPENQQETDTAQKVGEAISIDEPS